MLICVVYGDGQTLLCNSDCVSANLLGYVKKKTGNLDCEVVDLADETGTLQPCRRFLATLGSRVPAFEMNGKEKNILSMLTDFENSFTVGNSSDRFIYEIKYRILLIFISLSTYKTHKTPFLARI